MTAAQLITELQKVPPETDVKLVRKNQTSSLHNVLNVGFKKDVNLFREFSEKSLNSGKNLKTFVAITFNDEGVKTDLSI